MSKCDIWKQKEGRGAIPGKEGHVSANHMLGASLGG